VAKRGNGEGNIRKLKNRNLWECRYVVGNDPKTGKLIRRSVYAKTRAEVKDELDKIKEQQNQGAYHEFDKLTLNQWMDIYLWQIKRPNLKPKTFSQYAEDTEKNIKPSNLAKMKIKDVRRFHVQSFIDDMENAGRSPFAIRRIYAVLRNSFNTAVKRGVIPVSYAGGVSLPKTKPKKTAILTIAGQQEFIEAIEGHRLEAAFIVALTTGIREGELTALTWDDYNNGSISVTKDAARVDLYNEKTHKKIGSHIIVQDTPKTAAGDRCIPLLPIAKDALSRHRIKQNNEHMKHRLLYRNNKLIFCDEIGRMYDPKHFYCELQKVLTRAELNKIKFHALRHTFATRGLEKEIPIKAMQKLLGHETPDMVMHYQQLLDEQAQVEIGKLADVFK
jgi:integrase